MRWKRELRCRASSRTTCRAPRSGPHLSPTISGAARASPATCWQRRRSERRSRASCRVEAAMSAEIVGPFEEYRLIVDGYSVPCVEARENDGGTVTFIVDKRLAWTIPAAAFDDVAHSTA